MFGAQYIYDNDCFGLEVEDAACEMLRSLPYCSVVEGSDRKMGEWYYDFLVLNFLKVDKIHLNFRTLVLLMDIPVCLRVLSIGTLLMILVCFSVLLRRILM